jgi:hypothetical protein
MRASIIQDLRRVVDTSFEAVDAVLCVQKAACDARTGNRSAAGEIPCRQRRTTNVFDRLQENV